MATINDTDYELKIYNYIRSHPTGVTINDLCEKVNCSRNTASKYLLVLKRERKVRIRKIGRNKLYFAAESGVISKNIVISFLKGILSGLKEGFPDNPEMFKELGKKAAKYLDFSLERSNLEEITFLKENFKAKFFLTKFKDVYPYFDLFQDSVKVSLVNLDLKSKKAHYRFQDSDFLGTTDDFIFYYYGVCGILEAFFLEHLEQRMICSVENIEISNKSEESFIEISIQIIS